MNMQIVTTYFDNPSGSFKKLLRVFLWTCLEWTDVKPRVLTLPFPTTDGERKQPVVSNNTKLKTWQQYIESCDDGSKVLLTDCDIMLVGDPLEGFDHTVDISYTKRSRSYPVLNGGVLYVVVSPQTKDFFQEWQEVDQKMTDDENYHKDYYWPKYAGINQSSFGYMLEEGEHSCDLNALPCRRYNVCDEDWRKPADPTRTAIHVKSDLRKAALGTRFRKRSNTRRHQRLMRLAQLWKDKLEESQHLEVEDFFHNTNKTEKSYAL